MTSLGSKIKELRKNKKMTQLELCDGLVTPSMISQIESGRAMPSPTLLKELATRLGVESDYFVNEISTRSDNSQMYRKARSLMLAKKWDEALPLLLEISGMAMFQYKIESIYSDLVHCYEALNLPSEASLMLEEMLKVAFEKEDIAGAVHVYYELGSIERKRGRQSIARMYWKRACDLLNRHADLEMPIAQKLYSILGRSYLDDNKMELARKSYQMAYELAQKYPTRQDLGSLLQGLAVSYIATEDYAKGHEYNEMAFAMLSAAQNHKGIGMCRVNRAHILRLQGHYVEAVEELNSFISSRRSEADLRILANAYGERSQSRLELQQFDEAMCDAQKAVSLDQDNFLLQCEMHRVRAQSFLHQNKLLQVIDEIQLGLGYIEKLPLSRREVLHADLVRMERETHLNLGNRDEAVARSMAFAKAILNVPGQTTHSFNKN